MVRQQRDAFPSTLVNGTFTKEIAYITANSIRMFVTHELQYIICVFYRVNLKLYHKVKTRIPRWYISAYWRSFTIQLVCIIGTQLSLRDTLMFPTPYRMCRRLHENIDRNTSCRRLTLHSPTRILRGR